MGGRAAKIKGKNFERKVATIINDALGTNVKRIPCSGALPDWKGDLRELDGPLRNFVFECKNQERLNIWDAIRQAEKATLTSLKIPVVVFTKNFESEYVCLNLRDFLAILSERKTNG